MKIVLWPTHYLPFVGGLEVLTHSLAKQLSDWGHEIKVLANGEERKDYQIEGIQVHTFPFIKILNLFKLRKIGETVQEIREIIRSFSPDLVNVHGWFECFCFFQGRVLRGLSLPLCITVHGLLEQKYYQTSECMELWSMAKMVNTVSEALRSSLYEQKLHHPHIRVIHNGLPVPSDPPQEISFQEPQLLMVGRLTEEKRFIDGFQALALLRTQWPNLRLRLVGGGTMFGELQALRRSLQLEEAIEMTDFVPPPRVRGYIDAASIVLVPSRYESFGLVALDAAMRGRPVVASDVMGLKEVVVRGKTGLLVAPESPNLIAEAVDLLLSDPARMVAIGRHAADRAWEQFSIQTTARQYLEMYNRVVCSVG